MIRNIVANYIGKFWSLLSVFIFVPLYIQILGFDSYSIISFMLIIAGIIIILDSGLSATLAREFARADCSLKEKQKTLNSLETIYIGILIFLIFIIWNSSNYIAVNFINVEDFTTSELSLYVKLIGVEVAFQMLFRFYLGGIYGLEKQVIANIIQVIWGVLRNGLVLIIIYLIPTLFSFFGWQMIVTIIVTLTTKVIINKIISKKIRLHFALKLDVEILRRVWKFAAGMMLISILAALNTQMDKFIISQLISIKVLGYYTLGISLASILITIVSPISIALLPRFTSLYSENRNSESKEIFIIINISVTLVVFVFMSIMIFYSHELIWIWTGNLDLASNSGRYLPFLALSFSMLSLAIIPYNIAIANGYTRLNNILGIVGVIFILPGYYLFTKLYGAIGAAVVFSVVQLITTLVYYYVINKKYLKISNYSLFVSNMFFPLVFILLLTWIYSLLPIEMYESRWLTFFWIGLGTFLIFIISTIVFINKEQFFKLRYKSIK